MGVLLHVDDGSTTLALSEATVEAAALVVSETKVEQANHSLFLLFSERIQNEHSLKLGGAVCMCVCVCVCKCAGPG